ncbi:RNA-binding protein [Schizosaccharomyces cryophilus OY26]|uniref:RNA-binding protein n=1 Tax=Schizosaccharomyces cryophilus (strain OY26 / ATCC MYA-4695 / CBS 11777 / NBRC 106824 / NRRL Y48691) TaxID=653667 RepID=S9X1X3_SCHCR|nr:RNA-binding protein [Schizosaccharomyces cryophilus OY26]EPY51107.1 RNA-binding protein [Schizosaccharomyces cryophilus OY26]
MADRRKATIHVGNLAPGVTENVLYNAFIAFGEIITVALHNKEKADRSFAFLEFESPEDAKEAIANMNYSVLYDRVIRVSPANYALSTEETPVPDSAMISSSVTPPSVSNS